MPRLLIVSLNGDPTAPLGTLHAGGQCKYILELGKNLVLAGWSIDVATIQNPGTPSSSRICQDFRILRFPLSTAHEYSYDTTPDDTQSISMAVIEFLAAHMEPHDLVLGCYWLSGNVAIAAASFLRRSLLFSFSSLGLWKQHATHASNLGNRILEEQRIAQVADGIIASTNEEKDVLVRSYGIPQTKVHVIPAGIDLRVFHANT